MDHPITTIALSVGAGILANITTIYLRKFPKIWRNLKHFRTEFIEARLWSIEHYSHPQFFLPRFARDVAESILLLGLYVFFTFPVGLFSTAGWASLVVRGLLVGRFIGTTTVAYWEANSLANPKVKIKLK